MEYEMLKGNETKPLIRGENPARVVGDDTPPHRGSAVPSAGTKKEVGNKGEEPEGGFEPQPQ
jgi:cell division protease FtsH